ncbi:MAG: hypothetical protein MMC33_005356 [Icmadophila ericetorum]|nr:hypothetical protein [Icmadophila ericetorum]
MSDASKEVVPMTQAQYRALISRVRQELQREFDDREGQLENREEAVTRQEVRLDYREARLNVREDQLRLREVQLAAQSNSRSRSANTTEAEHQVERLTFASEGSARVGVSSSQGSPGAATSRFSGSSSKRQIKAVETQMRRGDHCEELAYQRLRPATDGTGEQALDPDFEILMYLQQPPFGPPTPLPPSERLTNLALAERSRRLGIRVPPTSDWMTIVNGEPLLTGLEVIGMTPPRRLVRANLGVVAHFISTQAEAEHNPDRPWFAIPRAPRVQTRGQSPQPQPLLSSRMPRSRGSRPNTQTSAPSTPRSRSRSSTVLSEASTVEGAPHDYESWD